MFDFGFFRQVPDLPHATAGPSKKHKKNKSGIEGRIMDPVARSAAQRAAKEARNANHLTLAAREKISVTDEEIMDIEPDVFVRNFIYFYF